MYVRLKTFEILHELGLAEDDVANLGLDTYRQIACLIVQDIADHLPVRVDETATTINSRLLFNALVFRGVLTHRVSDLATVSLQLYDSKQIIPAFIITRALLETVCLMFLLYRRIEEFNIDHDTDKLGDFLTKALLGSKNESTPFQSDSILKSVDKADKTFRGLRQMYDDLCEFTHPNWSGVLAAYSVYDDDSHIMNLRKNGPSTRIEQGVAPFVQSLVMFSDYYNGIAEQIIAMDAYFLGLSGDRG